MSCEWVKLSRAIIESRVFQNDGLLKVWIWCLARANWRRSWISVSTGRGVTEVQVEAGQFVFGRKTAAKALKMSPATVQTRMQKLEDMQNIVIQPGMHYSVVTVCNWERYQHASNLDHHANGQASINQPSQRKNTGLLHIEGSTLTPRIDAHSGGEPEISYEERRAAALLVPIPEAVNTPAFVAEWTRWRSHLAVLMKGGLSQQKLESDVVWCARQGESAAIAAIRFTISKGYWRELKIPDGAKSQTAASPPVASVRSTASLLREQEALDRKRGAK